MTTRNQAASCSQGRLLLSPDSFTGWSSVGYWAAGQLIGRPIRLESFIKPARKSYEDRKASRLAWKKAVELAQMSGKEATDAMQDHLGYAIPTL